MSAAPLFAFATTDPPLRATAGLIREVVCFCLRHGGQIYRGWNAGTIFRYFAFHFMSEDLLVTFDGASGTGHGEIAGVFIGWREFARSIEERERNKEFHFNWRLPPEGGDALMIGDVIIDPHGRDARATRTRLLQEASARWPDWKMRRLFTHRRGRLVELSHAAVLRLFVSATPAYEQPVSS